MNRIVLLHIHREMVGGRFSRQEAIGGPYLGPVWRYCLRLKRYRIGRSRYLDTLSQLSRPLLGRRRKKRFETQLPLRMSQELRETLENLAASRAQKGGRGANSLSAVVREAIWLLAAQEKLENEGWGIARIPPVQFAKLGMLVSQGHISNVDTAVEIAIVTFLDRVASSDLRSFEAHLFKDRVTASGHASYNNERQSKQSRPRERRR